MSPLETDNVLDLSIGGILCNQAITATSETDLGVDVERRV